MGHTLKLSPQPHVPFMFGLLNINSDASLSVWQSISVPSNVNWALESIRILTPVQKKEFHVFKKTYLKCLLEVVSVVQCFEKQFYKDSCLLINYQLKHSPSCNTSSSNFAFSLAYSIVYVKPLQPLVLTPIFKPI